MNDVIQVAEMFAQFRTGEGLTRTDGPGGVAVSLDFSVVARVAIVKMTNSAGSYPTYENDRYVFPARISAGPAFDSSDVDLAHTEKFLESPSINIYNLAKCWLFENDYIPAVQINGYWWTYNRRPMTATADAAITKGNLGTCTTVNSPTVAITDCRALFGPTVSGKKVLIEHDGVEWVIVAEECP